jgi:hypothetical protein
MRPQLIVKADRRSPNRLPTPDCPRCGDEARVIGITRTAGFVYFRCNMCDELLVEPSPAPASET